MKPNSSPDTPLTINPNTVNDIEECVTIDFEEERQKPAPVQESRKPTPISTEIHHEQTGLAIEMSQASEELSPINVPFVQNVENTDTLSPDETGPSFKSPELPPSAPVNNHIPIKDPMNDDADKTFLNPADEYDDDITVSDHAPGTTLAAINKNYHHISLHNASITQPTDVLDLIEFDPF